MDDPDIEDTDVGPARSGDRALPGSTARVLCVGIDLDDLRYYRAIHGLPSRADTPLVFEAAVPRFLDFCDRVGVRATLFAIGEDLRWGEAREALRAAVARGNDVESHSHAHAYDLSRRPPDDIERDVLAARTAIEDAIGCPVLGFRAPGYNLSDVLLRAVVKAGHRYDASILPSPPYFAARAAVIAAMRLRGRHSVSIVGRGRDFVRSRDPFVWPGTGLREFPITACGLLRLPLIGTTLARGGFLAARLIASAARLSFVHVEFHALDFLDTARDGIEPDLLVEPALRVPLADRMSRFEEALRALMSDRRNRLLADL